MDSSKYKTTKERAISEGYYSGKRSRFLAFAHHVDFIEEALEIVKEYRKEYYDARHYCYAYRVGFDDTEFQADDDGEPSSTASKPILEQIDSYGLTNTLACIIRYYGDMSLGTSGLVAACHEATADALSSSEIEEKFIEEEVKYTFTYPMVNDVMRIIKETNPRIANQVFDSTCKAVLSIKKGQAEELHTWLEGLSFD